MREMKREQGINDLIQPGGERKRCAVTLALVAELAVRLSADPSCAPNPSSHLAPECACPRQGCCKSGNTKQSNRGQGDGSPLAGCGARKPGRLPGTAYLPSARRLRTLLANDSKARKESNMAISGRHQSP